MLGRALIKRGEWERAEVVLSEAVEMARREGEEGIAADAVIELWWLRLHTDAQTTHEQIADELARAIPVLEELHDEAGLARALSLSASLLFWNGKTDDALVRFERSLAHARKAGDRLEEVAILRRTLMAAFHGSEPAEAALKRLDAVAEYSTGASDLDVDILRFRAELEAMQGNVDKGIALVVEARALAEQLGLTSMLASGVSQAAGEIELLAGNPAAAERELRAGTESLEQIGDWGHLVTVIPYLADALLEQGRVQEAAPLIERGLGQLVADDADAQIGLRRVWARLLAEEGNLGEAEQIAREAVVRAEATDYLNVRGRALRDLAEVLSAASRLDEAVAAFEQAVDVYERKGNIVMASRTQGRLEDLRGG
jgi:tetratricopeptide (TPR) repeat protein